jgi:hypothetical protein
MTVLNLDLSTAVQICWHALPYAASAVAFHFACLNISKWSLVIIREASQCLLQVKSVLKQCSHVSNSFRSFVPYRFL